MNDSPQPFAAAGRAHHTDPDSGPRCLVTGATGHIGAALVERLVAEGVPTCALVRAGSDLSRLGDAADEIELVQGDLGDPESLRAAVRAARPEVLFHLAWRGVTGAARNDSEQITLNLSGSLALFEAFAEAGGRTFAGLGSQAEYGPHRTRLTEELPTRPETAYGVSKLCLGMLTRKLADLAGVRHLWFRVVSTYGPRDDPQHLIPGLIAALLAARRPPLTAGDQLWDYLYVDDAAAAIADATLRSAADGVFVVASGEARPVRDIAETIRDLVDPELPLGFGEVPYREDQVMHLLGDPGRLRRDVGWTPATPLEEGLRRTVEWYRDVARVSA